MWRKLFSRLSLFSLVLCLGCLAWWYRTSSKVDELAYQREDVEVLRLAGSEGKVALTHTLYDAKRSRLGPARVHWDSIDGTNEPTVKNTALGFAYRSQPRNSGGRESTLVVPMWMLACLFSVMPLAWTWGRIRRNQKIEKLKGKHE
jgi:hypothetical protein